MASGPKPQTMWAIWDAQAGCWWDGSIPDPRRPNARPKVYPCEGCAKSAFMRMCAHPVSTRAGVARLHALRLAPGAGGTLTIAHFDDQSRFTARECILVPFQPIVPFDPG
jgi:hypothetical protein